MILSYRICIIFSLICITSRCEGSAGTTRHIREIFLGRCYEFQETRKNAPKLDKNCYELYNIFETAVKSQQDCNSKNSTNAFDEFFRRVDPGKTPANKAIFWSGTMELAQELSKTNDDFTTLSHTLPGYIANGLTFCGGNSTGVFNYTTCTCSWPSSIAAVFWIAASRQFARNAQGTVSVLLNGTKTDGTPAYRGNSIFAEAELPNINPSQVHKIRILVGWDLSRKPRESCGHESIKKLQNDIEQRKIKAECVDNPRAAFYILCANYPNSSACKRHLQTREADLKKWRIVGSIFIAISVILLAILVVMFFCNYRKGTAKNAARTCENTSLVKT